MFRSHKDRHILSVSKYNKNNVGYNSETISCDFCDAGYLSESEVEVHRRKVHKRQLEKLFADDNKFMCYTCIKEFPNEQEVIKHTKVEHLLSPADALRIEREIFVCDLCSSIFFNKDMLTVHLLQVHYVSSQQKNDTWVACPHCSKPIRLRGAWCHFQKHEMPSVSCCKVCFTKCKNRKSLQQHLRTHPSHLYCNICGYVAKKSNLFNNHIFQRHKYKMDPHQIVECKKYFVKQISTRYKEIRWKFENQCAWRGVNNLNGLSICVLCREICEDDCSMNLHIVRDHMTQMQEAKTRHVCACGGEFFNNILLKHHVFKMKGSHRVLAQHEIPEKSEELLIKQNSPEIPEIPENHEFLEHEIPETSGAHDLII